MELLREPFAFVIKMAKHLGNRCHFRACDPQCTSDHGSLDASQPCSEGLLGSLIYIKMVTVSRGLWLGARWERMLGVRSLLVSLPPSNPGGGVVFRCAIREL